jgi:hypothetical protein
MSTAPLYVSPARKQRCTVKRGGGQPAGLVVFRRKAGRSGRAARGTIGGPSTATSGASIKIKAPPPLRAVVSADLSANLPLRVDSGMAEPAIAQPSPGGVGHRLIAPQTDPALQIQHRIDAQRSVDDFDQVKAVYAYVFEDLVTESRAVGGACTSWKPADAGEARAGSARNIDSRSLQKLPA